MNIFLHELRTYRKSVLIWACSMSVLAVLYIFVFKGLGKEIESFQVFLNNMPDVMRKVFGAYIESISTLVGFYSFVFSFIVLCGAIQAMSLGVGILSKEGREKTSDFLLTKPIGRKKILISKLLAVLAALAVTNIIYLVLTISAAVILMGEFDLKLFIMISLTLLFVQLIFAALGILVSVVAEKIKSVVSISLSTVFGFYIIGSLGSILGEEKVRYLSPFRYFDSVYIAEYARYEPTYLILGIIFCITAVAASCLIYEKKDVHAV